MRRITLEQIKNLRPCPKAYSDAVIYFAGRESVEVTEKAAVRVAQLFNFMWLAYNILSPSALNSFKKKLAFMNAWGNYLLAEEGASRAYRLLQDGAPKTTREKAAAKKAHKRAHNKMVAAWRECNKAKARAFVRAYNEDAPTNDATA